MLVENGRLLLDEAIDRWFERVIALPSLRLVPLDARIAIESVRLPGSFHPDPADRMIVATARTLRCPLMTADRAILAYSHLGHVETIDAES
ncbi:PIN domain-containing protein [Rhizobium sp. RU20A]|nr:PIN domain-containing protein [Rhizobium sp. RU20A]